MRCELLVSTLDALLHVTCGPSGEDAEVAVLQRGQGVYFGLTRGTEGIYAVARNYSLEEKKGNPRGGINQILHFSWDGIKIGPSEFVTHFGPVADLHQIRFEDGYIWLVSTRKPHLVVFEARKPENKRQMNLTSFVPHHLHHPPKPNHHGDIWHFNSLQFEGNSLHILAHNWDYGAFALEFHKAAPTDFFRAPKLLRVTEGLGMMSHDIYAAEDGLWVLDSGGGNLLRRQNVNGESIPLALGQIPAPFPRGLAADAERFFIGCGTVQAQRELRGQGESCVLVMDRKSKACLGQIWLGAVGDVCDLLLLEPRDLTD